MSNKFVAVFALAFGLSIAPLAIAQECAIPTQTNTISVGADGEYEGEPDTALLQFNISVQEDKAMLAYEHAAKSAEQIRQVSATMASILSPPDRILLCNADLRMEADKA